MKLFDTPKADLLLLLLLLSLLLLLLLLLLLSCAYSTCTESSSDRDVHAQVFLNAFGQNLTHYPTSLLSIPLLFPQALQKDPANRLGCKDAKGEDAKKHSFFRNMNWVQLEAGIVQPPFVPDVSRRSFLLGKLTC